MAQTPALRAGAASFESLSWAVWEVAGTAHVVVSANAAARELLDPVRRHEEAGSVSRSPLADIAPGLATPEVLRQLTLVRDSGEAIAGATWTLDTAAPAGHVLFEVDLVPVDRPDGRAVLVHARRARRTATAVEHEATTLLHRALLPATLPVLPCVRLAAGYLPAAVGSRAGGDWFDVVPLPDGRLALTVGDTVGCGPGAAVAAAELRSVLRAALLDGTTPEDALARLDRHAGRAEATRAATLVIVVLDADGSAVAHAEFGHPPPLLADATGTRALTARAHGPLGIGGAGRVVLGREPLAAGAAVVLVSNGVMRGRETGAAARPEEVLAGVATGSGDDDQQADPAVLCDAALTAPGVGTGDDATALAVVRRRHEVPVLDIDVPARPEELAGVRARVGEWLDLAGVGAHTLTAVPLVVSELVSNSIEHAYRGTAAGRVRVRAELDGYGAVRIEVTDHGTWRSDQQDDRDPGFGLAVARELSRALHVGSGPAGTSVVAHCEAHRPAAVVEGGARLTRVDDGTLTVARRPGRPPVLVLSGPIDLGTVAELRSSLLHGSAGGTRPVLLDLSRVTLLGSAGVRLLHEVAAYPAPPRLHAPPGSPSRRVLELGRLEHLLAEPA